MYPLIVGAEKEKLILINEIFNDENEKDLNQLLTKLSVSKAYSCE